MWKECMAAGFCPCRPLTPATKGSSEGWICRIWKHLQKSLTWILLEGINQKSSDFCRKRLHANWRESGQWTLNYFTLKLFAKLFRRANTKTLADALCSCLACSTPLPGGVRGPCGCEVWARLQRLLRLCPGAGGQHGQLPGERDQREGSDGSVQVIMTVCQKGWWERWRGGRDPLSLKKIKDYQESSHFQIALCWLKY